MTLGDIHRLVGGTTCSKGNEEEILISKEKQ